MMDPAECVISRCVEMTNDRRLAINAAFPALAFDALESAAFLGDPDNLLLLATSGDRVCGVLYGHRLQRLDSRRSEVLLYSIDVHEAFRRQGVGARLIAAVKSWAIEIGAAEVWVLTEGANVPAMALYRATGGIEGSPDTRMFIYPLP